MRRPSQAILEMPVGNSVVLAFAPKRGVRYARIRGTRAFLHTLSFSLPHFLDASYLASSRDTFCKDNKKVQNNVPLKQVLDVR